MTKTNQTKPVTFGEFQGDNSDAWAPVYSGGRPVGEIYRSKVPSLSNGRPVVELYSVELNRSALVSDSSDAFKVFRVRDTWHGCVVPGRSARKALTLAKVWVASNVRA